MEEWKTRGMLYLLELPLSLFFHFLGEKKKAQGQGQVSPDQGSTAGTWLGDGPLVPLWAPGYGECCGSPGTIQESQ